MFSFVLIAAAGMVLGAESLTTGEIEEVADGYVFTEGPLWLTEEEKWIFSDVRADTIYDSNGERHLKPSKNINGLALDKEGRVVACQSGTHSIVRLERNGIVTVLASEFEGKTLNGTNDLVVRSDGMIFFTDPKAGRDRSGAGLGYAGVYALRPETGELRLVTDKMKYPNGIGFSPDEKTLYVSDTSGGGIWSYQVAADGSASEGTKLCKVSFPDGLAVDSAGNIWCTSSQGIVIFSDEGAEFESIKISMMPTNCAFGGTGKTTLLVTAREKVFRIRTIVSGR
ncbi:MAG: SMP-30/gluconolactonase/LRE family protein [Candidatus Hydrogenedentota bacterium]